MVVAKSHCSNDGFLRKLPQHHSEDAMQILESGNLELKGDVEFSDMQFIEASVQNHSPIDTTYAVPINCET